MNPFLGEIKMLPWDWPPKGWAVCNGALLSIAQNAALFSLLGTTYGGDGQTTFALPNLQGRAPVHRSTDGQYVQGQSAGFEQVTITLSTMPMHGHALLGTTDPGDKRVPKGALANNTADTNAYYGADTSVTPLNPTSISMVGGGQPHSNMQPYQVVGYCIALIGVFPSRN